MIISNINSGLGNQMFQYAAGRALSIKRGDALRLNLSAFAVHDIHYGFELERIFQCNAQIAGQEDMRRILGWQSSFGIRRILSRNSMAAFRRKEFVFEPHFHYWPEINQVPRNCFLVGYWQSAKYFKDISSIIRADFNFTQPLTDLNSELAEQITRVNAVSIHVRRGDYVSNPGNLTKHGICSSRYYKEAVQYISERIEKPCYFVFSDDMDWVRSNLTIDSTCFYVVHNNGPESYNDMRLMSLCRHHIIANSSFSWWGAWLNPSAAKIVVAPKRWFNDYHANTEDLLPEGWVVL
jgi:hypothetical protein